MKNLMKYLIIASGKMDLFPGLKEEIQTADRIVCADGGTAHAKKLGITLHAIIGDFDSSAPADIEYFKHQGIRCVKHPTDKDKSDTQLCVEWAVEHGATSITLLGVTGTRLDHTLANIFLLETLTRQNIAAKIMDSHNEIYAVTSKLLINGRPKDLLSILALGTDAKGVTVSGVEYPLANALVKAGSSLGISNVFTGNQVTITLETGCLLVTRSRD